MASSIWADLRHERLLAGYSQGATLYVQRRSSLEHVSVTVARFTAN